MGEGVWSSLGVSRAPGGMGQDRGGDGDDPLPGSLGCGEGECVGGVFHLMTVTLSSELETLET